MKDLVPVEEEALEGEFISADDWKKIWPDGDGKAQTRTRAQKTQSDAADALRYAAMQQQGAANLAARQAAAMAATQGHNNAQMDALRRQMAGQPASLGGLGGIFGNFFR